MRKLISSLLLVVLLSSPAIFAEDIAIVKVKNKFQEKVVNQAIESAHVRSGNDFTVSLNKVQTGVLSRAGISFDVLVKDADVSSIYLIRPRTRFVTNKQFDVFGEQIDIGNSMSIMPLARSEAASYEENPDFFVTSLTDLEIRIIYLPKSVANLFSEIDDFPTDTLALRVNQDSIYAFDYHLENFQTRYIYTAGIDQARDWIVSKFLAWGYTDVTTPSFYFNGNQYNVKCVKPGTTEPDKVIVIGGHYDSITYNQPTDPMDYAPGADDNGSGSALVLEIARILVDVPFRKTIVFMTFTAEEVGLVGSYYAADEFAYTGTDVEVMFNYDMVAYDPNNYYQLEISGGANRSYRDLTYDAALRVSGVNPIKGNSSPGGSDHASFDQAGFNICNNIEANFNYQGWHTNLDLTTALNFPFFTEVVKMATSALAHVANAAHPTEIEQIVDIGDGQALELFWSDCDPSYHYTIRYGTSSEVYTNSIIVPDGICSYTINGLTDGQIYYFGVFGDIDDGYPAIYTVESSEMPLLIPRAPANIQADPADHKILLDWNDNIEADFSYYRIYRKMNDLSYSLYEDNYVPSYYEDVNTLGQIQYTYKLTAVDFDGYESDYSEEVEAFAATFDGGILVVDDMTQTNPLPDQTEQLAYFDSLFDGTPHGVVQVESYILGEKLSRNIAGQYSSIFWFDDDLSPNMIPLSEDTLDWYLNFETNVFVSGYAVLSDWTQSPLYSSHLLYREFGVTSYNVNTGMDFAGAKGEGSWPDLQMDPGIMFTNMPNIPVITTRSGATIIYRFDSFTNSPLFENQPCGVLYATPEGLRIFLTFPVYFLTTESATALISFVKQTFGETAVIETAGDVNGSGTVDIGDVVYIVDYFFGGGPPPIIMNTADVNGSCVLDISDLTYLVNYIFLSGPMPVVGCIE